MKTLAVIPARLGATRLPRKPLRLLAGVALVVRVWERVVAMRVADRCVIATDAEEVARVVREAGAEVVMTRADHPSGTDRVAEVAEMVAYRTYEILVNVQGDEPFVSPDAIRGACDLTRDGHFPLATAAVSADAVILELPNVVKVVLGERGRALYFSRAPVPFLRDMADRETRDLNVYQHIGVYSYTRDALRRWVSLPPHALERIERLEQLRPLAAGLAMGVAVIADSPGPGIDTEGDLVRANERWDDFAAGRG